MSWSRHFPLVVLMAIGCASARSQHEVEHHGEEASDFERPTSTPREAFPIHADAALGWTQIIAGTLRGERVAQAVNERLHVAVRSMDGGLKVGLTELRSGAEQTWIDPPAPWSDALRDRDELVSDEFVGAIALDRGSASIAVTDGLALVHGRVGLADHSWSEASVLPPNGAQLMWVGRAEGGWVVIGGRRDRVGALDWRDYVAWSVEDTATSWPPPEVLAEREQHQYASVNAHASAAGVFAMAVLPDGVRGYVRSGERWVDVASPFPLPRTRTLLTPSRAGWVVETTTTRYPPDPQYPTTAVLIDAATHESRVLEHYPSAPDLIPLVIEDGKPLISNGRGNQSHGAAANSALVHGSVVYDIARDTTRKVAAPTTPGLEDAGWSPALRLDVLDRPCMVGGAVAHADWGQRYLDGAACLDLESLNWQWVGLKLGATDPKWIGSDEVSGGRHPPICRTLGTLGASVIVECTQRDIITIPANWEWPSRQERGRQEWTLQLVRFDA